MSGKPQRKRPKKAVQLRVDRAAYCCLLPLLQGDNPLDMSYSQLFESVVLLAREEYVSNTNQDFIVRLCSMKKTRVEEEMRGRFATARKTLHLTIDSEALEFLNMLASRYHALFHTRGEVASLIMRRVGYRAKTPERAEWMKRRLEEILLKYPVRY